jgi:hypothetical protein
LSAQGGPSPKCLGNVTGVSDKQLIVVDGRNVNVGIDGDLVVEVQCTSLEGSLRRTLLVSCKAAGGCWAHVHVRVMAVARQAVQAAIPSAGGCTGGR